MHINFRGYLLKLAINQMPWTPLDGEALISLCEAIEAFMPENMAVP